jgi:predicted RNA binding protein YcfA (HicA-like mRNA interferase family)
MMKIKEVIRMLEEDGWFIVKTRGSHRQFKHPDKPGRVTIAGKPSRDLAPGTLNSIYKQAGWKLRYLVIVEETESGYSAFSPDLPGCVAAGETREKVEQLMQETIQFHLQGLQEDGVDIPPSHTYSKYLDIPA